MQQPSIIMFVGLKQALIHEGRFIEVFGFFLEHILIIFDSYTEPGGGQVRTHVQELLEDEHSAKRLLVVVCGLAVAIRSSRRALYIKKAIII